MNVTLRLRKRNVADISYKCCLIKNNRGKLHFSNIISSDFDTFPTYFRPIFDTFPTRNGSNYSSGIGTSGITVSSLLTPVEPPMNIA